YVGCSMNVHNGLEGIVAAETRLSMVDGERGELVIAGYPVEELAPRFTFEETVAALFEAADFARELRAAALPPHSEMLLRSIAGDGVDVMDALRMAAGTLQEHELP